MAVGCIGGPACPVRLAGDATAGARGVPPRQPQLAEEDVRPLLRLRGMQHTAADGRLQPRARFRPCRYGACRTRRSGGDVHGGWDQ